MDTRTLTYSLIQGQSKRGRERAGPHPPLGAVSQQAAETKREEASKCNGREDIAEAEARRAAWGRGHRTQRRGRREGVGGSG